jgi:NAD(P)-dependent dehydrogenase (short-subunit alcohol dehydrogenase family)
MIDDSQPTILITGCTRGLGRAMVRGFTERGARVIGCARTLTANEAAYDSDQFQALDVSDDIAVAQFAKDTITKFGPPDFLINNAAVINHNANLWEVPAEEFSRVIDINIKGTANTIRHFLPAMIERGSGVIVNFSSGWGRSTSPEVAPYCATKFAIEGLTAALAQELPKGLAAVALNPGVIDTDMLRLSLGDSSSAYPSPTEWAKTAVPFIAKLGPKHNGAALTAP